MVYAPLRLGRWWPLDHWTVPLLHPAIFTFPPDVRGLPWGCRCADGRGSSRGEITRALEAVRVLYVCVGGGAGWQQLKGATLESTGLASFLPDQPCAGSRWPVPLPSPMSL